MDSSWYVAIQKEVISIIVTIGMQMTKPINGCANTKAYKVMEVVCGSEIVGS